ncbi:tautomerase PptA [Paraburkholderia madseniana]|uniref:Tautomerase PptA n=1 Tax=Paraburkholderia madseniana TaxID=2599607 RepID=A0A6N6W345_9BURK|nr:tautomerase family protein [Paraburkholderia madseniana]KAE8754234.1 tautomerase PptA [Paraburkholderia madseniana]
MPQIELLFVERPELTAEARQTIASELTEVLKRHLGSTDGSLSVGITEFAKAQWKPEIYDRTISPRLDSLIKMPGYSY